MTFVTVRMDPAVITAAAGSMGVDTTMAPGDQAREIVRRLAGQARTSTATAEGGAAPKRAGRVWENKVVEHANSAGFSWDRAPLRGRRDLLDVTGTLAEGLLIGCKAVEKGVPMSSKLWAAMEQCRRALEHLPRNVDPAGILPVQVIQRSGADVGEAYAVTEFDWLLRHILADRAH